MKKKCAIIGIVTQLVLLVGIVILTNDTIKLKFPYYKTCLVICVVLMFINTLVVFAYSFVVTSHKEKEIENKY